MINELPKKYAIMYKECSPAMFLRKSSLVYLQVDNQYEIKQYIYYWY